MELKSDNRGEIWQDASVSMMKGKAEGGEVAEKAKEAEREGEERETKA